MISLLVSVFISFIPSNPNSLQIDQRVSTNLGSCYLPEDGAPEEVPSRICLESADLLLHPQNPFEQPSAEISYSVSGQEMIRKFRGSMASRGQCFPDIPKSEYLKANIILSDHKISKPDFVAYTQLATILEFCFDSRTGWFHTSTPRITVAVQKMTDEHHPQGKREHFSYRLDD